MSDIENLTLDQILGGLSSNKANRKNHENNIKKIFRLRSEKKLDEAYNLVLQEYNNSTDLNSKQWLHQAYRWVLIDKIKISSINDSVTYFRDLLLLGVMKDDEIIKKQLVEFCNDPMLINNFIVKFIKSDVPLIINVILKVNDLNILNVKNHKYMEFFTHLKGNISYKIKILLIKKMFYFKANNNNFNFSIDEFIFFIENNQLTPNEYLKIENYEPTPDKEPTIEEILSSIGKKKPFIQDLSIEAVCEFLKSYRNNVDIFNPHNVLTSLCKSIKNKKIQYEINYFFSNCDGLVKTNWKQELDQELKPQWVIDQDNPLKKYEKPSAITFCEGIKSNKADINLNQEFWWCMKEACFGCTIQSHTSWNDYTIIDFLNIFEFAISEKEYIKFVHFLNRFERLKQHLYCHECAEIMYPVNISIDTKHAVTQFHCINNQCGKINQIIYLNDCLNGRCNAIIDSRVSKKCPNSWYICKKCGSCCSHAVFENNLKFWQKKNSLISSSFTPEFILNAVQNKIGHLEKAENYCYQCGQTMVEIDEDTFKCFDCDIKLSTKKYKLNKIRIHKDLRRKDYKVLPQ